MSDARSLAHPMIEPLDFALTPEAASEVLAGDALAVYGLLWNAALATAAEGPAMRQEKLVFAVTPPEQGAITALLQARQQTVEDAGWIDILPMEDPRLGDAENAMFPPPLQAALDDGATTLDANGTQRRGPQECAPMLQHVGAPSTWSCKIVDRQALQYDTLIEQMAANGVGRPSTFGGRLQQAVNNGLVTESAKGLVVGQYGQILLDALSKLPDSAVVNAAFCMQLETQLEEIERTPTTAGAVLMAFCERATGQATELATWLDGLEIEGESLDEALRRVAHRLPRADSWDHAALPFGINPRLLVRSPDEVAAVRSALDSLLAMPDTMRWKGLSARGRAVRRLAAITTVTPIQETKAWVAIASRDIVWRWWLDLGPDEVPFQVDELHAVEQEIKAAHQLQGTVLTDLYARLSKAFE